MGHCAQRLSGHEPMDPPPLGLSWARPSYAQVFLNTGFFPSFLRINVCDWHPCNLRGGEGVSKLSAREPLFPPAATSPTQEDLVPLVLTSAPRDLGVSGGMGHLESSLPNSCPLKALLFQKFPIWTRASLTA